MNSGSKLANELNSPEMLRFLGWLMLALSVAVLVLRPVAFPAEPYLWGGDYNTFWAASWLAQNDSLNELYSTKMLEGIPGLAVPAPPWFYPPPMLLVVYPAAWLPFLASYALFTGLSLLLAIGLWKVWRRSSLHLLLLLAAPAMLLNILYGQNGFISAFLWVGGLLLLGKRPFLSGCLLGLLIIKPQLILLAPVLLIAGKHWRALAGFVFSAIMMFNISWLAFGPDLWLSFIENSAGVAQLMQAGSVIDVTKIGSLYMGARMAGAGHTEGMLLQGLFALTAVFVSASLWRRRDVDFGYKAAAALVAVLMITPYQFIYDLTLLLGAIAFWHQAGEQRWQGIDRLCVWLLWLSPLLAQALASALGIGILPAILMLSLLRINISARQAAQALPA